MEKGIAVVVEGLRMGRLKGWEIKRGRTYEDLGEASSPGSEVGFLSE